MPETITTSLIEKYLDGSATQEERQCLEQWYAALMLDRKAHGEIAGIQELKATSWKALQAQIAEQTTAQRPVHRIRFLKTAWMRYAAAAIIILGIGAYLWNTRNEKRETRNDNSVPYAKQDAAPGGSKALLTLSDGRTIVLDSANNGLLAQEGAADIQKKDGSVVYLSERALSPAGGGGEAGGGPVTYNTMTTPRGGQYQLTLSDGTKVWLNAESSITYPTAFSEREGERERRVTITGEAYFEVAKDKTKPFIVTASRLTPHVSRREDQIDITVLGTHFNVNAYADEKTINTTLIEGSVRLTSHVSRLTPHDNNTVLTLKPGQQGQLNATTEKLSLAANPDVQQVMAWRSGLFNFNNVKFKDAMHQLERWYDVDVEYRNGIPEITFGGKMQRDLNLSQALRLLNAMGVTFKIEGKKLIVVRGER